MARYRPVHVKIWSCDEKFQEYSKDGKLLFVYLITNDHLTESGLYKITYKTMANETDIPKGEIRKLINGELKNNVSYDESKSVAFVHKFLEHNGGGNPKLVKISINKDRAAIKTRLWKEFDKFYSIDLKPLDNPLPKDAPITITNTITITKKDGPSPPNLSQIEKKILKELKEATGFPLKKSKDFENTLFFIRKLMLEFPDVDALEEIKKKCAWWIKKPLVKKSNPHLQLRNWFIIAQKGIDEAKSQHQVGAPRGKYSTKYPMLFLNNVYKILRKQGKDNNDYSELLFTLTDAEAKQVAEKYKDTPAEFIKFLENK